MTGGDCMLKFIVRRSEAQCSWYLFQRGNATTVANIGGTTPYNVLMVKSDLLVLTFVCSTSIAGPLPVLQVLDQSQ